jgi:methionyl aminopeptidase
MTPLKANEIRLMEKAGQLAAQALQATGKYVRAGITTDELDKIANDFVLTKGAIPSSLGYHGFPKSICTSVNHCICHGLPDGTVLKDGDIINIDIAVTREGFIGDTSAMFYVGAPSEKAKSIVEAAYQAMHVGIEQVKARATTGDIGFEVNKFVTKKGYWVVKEIGGHGVNKIYHDEPWIPSYGKKGKGTPLLPWITITVEPMINETNAPIKEFSIPNSAVKYYETSDKVLSAQWEHTVLVTDTGHQILTQV